MMCLRQDGSNLPDWTHLQTQKLRLHEPLGSVWTKKKREDFSGD